MFGRISGYLHWGMMATAAPALYVSILGLGGVNEDVANVDNAFQLVANTIETLATEEEDYVIHFFVDSDPQEPDGLDFVED